MKASIITIGDELLNGQTIDTNSAWISRELNSIGIEVIFKMTPPDSIEDIEASLSHCSSISDVVMITGGLGPTHDDVTKKALVKFTEDEFLFNPEVFEDIKEYFKKIGRIPTEAHRLQCYLPSKAELLHNSRGTAPGMMIEFRDTLIISMPGVPGEMKTIMQNEAIPRLADLNNHKHIYHYIIQTAGIGESVLSEEIADIIDSFPSEISLAYLPGIASVKLRLTGIGTSATSLANLVHGFGRQIEDRIGDVVFGHNSDTLEEVVGRICLNNKLKIGTAESCTGGNIAARLTRVPGASRYFEGSIVSYSNDVKMNTLSVAPSTLEKVGAVSEETVQEMVSGVIERLHVDIGIAVSGIAGPSGAVPGKPVGTIWVAVGNKQRTVTKKLQLARDRERNIQYTTVLALNQLRLFLEDKI